MYPTNLTHPIFLDNWGISNTVNFYGEGVFPPQNPRVRGPFSCRMFATACSIYSQMPSILHPQPVDERFRGDEDPRNEGYSSEVALGLNADCYANRLHTNRFVT
jgi:hypothetical protein